MPKKNTKIITLAFDLSAAVWKTDSMAKVPLPCIGTAVKSELDTPETENV